MSEWTQTDIFDHGAGPRPHARMTDPVSSDLTMQSLGRDTSYKRLVMEAVILISAGDELTPVTDDMILAYLEEVTERRHQRNVVARTRGLLREAGWLKRVDDVEGVTGRPTIAHIPTSAGLAVWKETT